MSSIEKMSIQGIRSFGPDDKDRGIIKFYAPLTLILGPNGTGKTTIIECLKYMTTGSLPAGGKQAAAFIHDPKVANEREVKAQVVLQFRSVTGKQHWIKRSLSATQQVKSVKMTTLDSVLTWATPDGRKESITSRCNELDKEMVSLLGVGKAVLENVIFCHQEDACWPLSEGKALKQKFDDIFASTRYVKALDIMKKLRQELHMSITSVAAEMKYLKQNKIKAQELRSDLDETKIKYNAAKDTVSRVREKLQPIEEKLNQLSSKEGDILKLHTEIEKMKSERDQMLKAMQELRDSIENEFTGSTAELEKMLDDFHDKVKEREMALKEMEREQTKLDTELNALSQQKSTLLVELGKLEQEAQLHMEGIANRDKLVKRIANTYNLEGFSGRLDDERVTNFLEKFKQNALDLQKKARETRVEFEKKEATIQSNIDDVRNKRATLDTEITLKEDTIAKNTGEIREINQRLSRVDASKDRLVDVDGELKKTSRDLAEREDAVDLDGLLMEIDDLAVQRRSLDAQFKRLDDELSRMHLESKGRTELEMLKKDRATKQEHIRKLKTRNEDSLQHLLGLMPADNFSRELNNYISTQSRRVQSENKDYQQFRMELSGKRQERKSLMEQLTKKKEELKGYEDKIYQECETQNFDDGLVKLSQKLEEKREQKGLFEGMTHVYNKYVSKLRSTNPPCPLCQRTFSSDTEVDELIDNLERKLQIVPDRLLVVDNEITECQQKYNRLIELRPYRSAIADLSQTDVPNMETRLKNVDEHMEKVRNNIEEKEEVLEMMQVDEATAKSLQSDMVLLDKYITDLRELNGKIAAQSAKISSGDSDRTLQQVQSEREDVQERLETVRSGYERKQKKATEQERQVQQLKSAINDLRAEKLTIERDLQDRTQLEQSKSELLATNGTLTGEITEARDQLKPLKDHIAILLTEREKIGTKKDDTYEKDTEQFNKMQESAKDVTSWQVKITRYVRDGRAEALEDSTRSQHHLERKAGEIVDQRDRINIKIQKIRKDLDTQRMREREMQDNLLLLRRREEIKEKAGVIKQREEKLGGLDVTSLEQEKSRLHDQQDDLRKEKHTAEGRKQTLEVEVSRFMKELQDDQYRNAEENYQEKMITLRTTEIASSDVEKFCKAVDRGIMNFHSQKMTEINMIIRELWRNTYRGNDIETIEIRSDEDEASIGTAKRRTYNYRVVMIRRDVALDMRGRCSAGQRVLASLIIRLALAETFCLNCGILALDEPTTNLDRENIESLAYALVEIIKGRAQQKNFQLVIITHDEDFVDLLGRSDYVDKFFKVRKDKYGCSELVEADVKDLGSR